MKMFVLQAGGYKNVLFIQQDLSYKFHIVRRKEIVDGDAKCAIGYLSGKQDADLMFFYKYVVDENEQISETIHG